jgi:hypothetical protein
VTAPERHPRWCRPSTECDAFRTPYGRHRSRTVVIGPDFRERDELRVYVVGPVGGDFTPTITVETYIAAANLLVGRVGLTQRQSRVLAHLLRRIVRRVGGDE